MGTQTSDICNIVESLLKALGQATDSQSTSIFNSTAAKSFYF